MSRKKWRNARGGRRGLVVSAAIAAVAILVVGMGMGMGMGLGGAEPTAGPTSDLAESAGGSGSESPTSDPEPSGPQMDRSEPRALVIPAIDVHKSLLKLGTKKNDEDHVELPSPPSRPGWFTQSVTPGEVGVSTIIGYIRKSASQPGVFSHLSDLSEKDTITVTRKDGSKAIFRVTEIETYPEGELPESKVYGATSRPELRLITSGGKLHPQDPVGNVVVYAHLVDSR